MTAMTVPLSTLCRAALFALQLCAWTSLAQAAGDAGDSDWLSYRDAYRQMIVFEKYGKPKQFLQNHYRIRGRDRDSTIDGLRLSLNSKSVHLALPLDALGRIVFPFSKAAYDDNAELDINRKADQFQFGPWVSIVTRTDGYPRAELELA